MNRQQVIHRFAVALATLLLGTAILPYQRIDAQSPNSDQVWVVVD